MHSPVSFRPAALALCAAALLAVAAHARQSGAAPVDSRTPVDPAAPSGAAEPQGDPRAPGAPSKDALRMGSPAQLPATASRETMWPAPTADDWKLPCLVAWQRSFDDARRVAQATGKPLLICVNMDGEIASEHYAGIRYRRPETARLYEPYVCVIASVYRHNPRDYDDAGQRIPCPRFGTVTCGEHIAIEPGLYETYFEGSRIAPRHIMVELDLKKTYDVYFAWDTQTIFTALEKGIADRPAPPPLVEHDRPVVERVASADAADRVLVERTYAQGTREVRRALLERALVVRDLDQVDLLRQAIFGLDVELARLARRALVQCTTESAVDLIAEALKLPLDAAERGELVAAAARLAEKFPRARMIVAVNQGLAGSSKLIDADAWSQAATSDTGRGARATYEAASRLETQLAAADARPEDAAARLALAETFHARAEAARGQRGFARVLVEDAQRTAREAEALGARGYALEGLLAVCASELGARPEALAHAVKAVEAGLPPPASDGIDAAAARAAAVFALFAEARQGAIARAFRERQPWPPEWLSDIHAAYAVLARHPLGTDAHAAAHYDFLRWLGATPRATQVLERGLERFPESPLLHERLRRELLATRGAAGLEAGYAERLARAGASPALEWFAGYAALVAAEHQRRASAMDAALAAYDRAREHFARYSAAFPANAENAEHYTALAYAGRARIAFERGDLERATLELLASFHARPSAAASADGLNVTAVDTAKMLRARLVAPENASPVNTALVTELDAALAALDPALLELPAYERSVSGRGDANAPRR